MIEITAATMLSIVIAGGVEYSVFDVGSLSGADNALPPGTIAAGVSDQGTVVGASVLAGTDADFRAFAWKNGTMSELMKPAMYGQSQAFAINGNDMVVGVTFQLGELLPIGMSWTSSGFPAILGDIVPQDVSDTGVIVGVAPTDYTGLHFEAAMWDTGVLTTLPGLGGSDSVARAIAADGRIVGGATPAGAVGHQAVVWINGKVASLGTPGGPTSEAFDISDSGRVVGHGRTAAGEVRAFMADIDSGGVVQSFTTLGAVDDTFSYARAINDANIIVGTSNTQAIRWDGAGTMAVLNDLIPSGSGWNLTHATDINSIGQIVGRGTHLGKPRAFILTPIDACPGDANGDLSVDFLDLNIVLDHWGALGGPGDVDGDGMVGFADLNLVLAEWGGVCR